MSERTRILRQHIAHERKLILEKSALEIMLKNVRAVRNKLKVEQVQLSSLVQSEMGQDASERFMEELNSNIQELNQQEKEMEVEFDPSNQPTLDLNVDSAGRNLFAKEDEEVEEEDEDEDDDSDGDVVCSMDVLGTQQDIDFDEF